jgi:hypothetical protein
MIITGPKHGADFIEGLDMLASMRLCANVPAQHAIQTALGGYQSINDLVLPGGRLREQRDLAWEMLNAIPGVSCVKPKGALYMFPRLDPKVHRILDDEKMIFDLLTQEKMLLVQGTAFNYPDAGPAWAASSASSCASAASRARHCPSRTTSTPSSVPAMPSACLIAKVVVPGPRMYRHPGSMYCVISAAISATALSSAIAPPCFTCCT